MKRRTIKKFNFDKRENNKEGFTLIELLVVIAIIAIIAAVIAILINPLELTRRGRDSTRLSDLANLQQAINVGGEETSPATNYYCGAMTEPASHLCGGSDSQGGAGAGVGQGAGTSTGGTRALDGTGWVKVALNTAAVKNVLQTPTLPIDPTNNDSAAGTYAKLHYTYCGTTSANATKDTYELATVLESNTYTVTQPKMSQDGGGDNNIYEVGSNLALITGAGAAGVCKY